MVDSIHNSAGSQKHTAQDQFLDGIGIGSRSVEDRDTQFGHARNGNVVGTGSASEKIKKRNELALTKNIESSVPPEIFALNEKRRKLFPLFSTTYLAMARTVVGTSVS